MLGVEGMTSEALRASEEVKSAKRAAAERATAEQDYRKAFFTKSNIQSKHLKGQLWPHVSNVFSYPLPRLKGQL